MTDPPEDEPPALDDVLDRDDDFALREQAAGGPAGVVGRLTSGLARQKRIVYWLVVSLAADVFLTAVLAVGINVLHSNKVGIDVNRAQIHQLHLADWNTCERQGLVNAQIQAMDAYLHAIGKSSPLLSALAASERANKFASVVCGPRP